MVCSLCGANGRQLYQQLVDRLYQAAGTWNLRECVACGLTWITPVQTEADIPALYKGYYTHQTAASSPPTALRLTRRILTSTVGRHMLALLVKLGALPAAQLPSLWRELWLDEGVTGCVLDVGCGNGHFLSALRSLGWQTKGVEPDAAAAAVAREAAGLDVLHSSLEAAKLPEARFDVITMNHVIEHLPDPLGTLSECYRILRPGGRLVIFTPNLASLGHRLFRSAWLHLDPPRHLFLFTPQTLPSAVERAGFRVESVRTVAGGAPLAWSASRMIQRWRKLPQGWRSQVPRSIQAQAYIFGLVERLLNCVTNSGEELALVAVREAA